MKLIDLDGPEVSMPDNAATCEIGGLTADSRAVRDTFLFAALPGTTVNGEQFVPAAIESGASALLLSETPELQIAAGMTVVRAKQPRYALAKMAARFYGRQPETIVAVTGTSGKTSVADFTRQLFAKLGLQAASLGTIGIVKPTGSVYGSLTTPDPVTVQKTLAELADEQITHVALEASSHGLDQYRLDGAKLAAGAFTNLGRDHMDYHATVEDYLNAKLRLFRELLEPGQPAVINVDAPFSDRVVDVVRERGLQLITVGRGGKTLTLQSVVHDGFQQALHLQHAGKDYHARLPLVGAYQTDNALVAAGLALAVGGAPDDVFEAMETLKGVPGRLEIVGHCNGGLVVIDYAHKPEALEAALDGTRPFVSGKLVCVFGCGGDRDSGKRPIMGKIAVEKADRVIVTDDNPRTEDPVEIRRQIMQAAKGGEEIGDRRRAIQAAISTMQSGDVVVIAGKGHETGQIVGRDVLPFSDHEEARQAMAQHDSFQNQFKD